MIAGSAQGTNIVHDWNTAYMDTIRLEGGAPTPVSRVGAMLFTSIYDTVMAVERTHIPYHVKMPKPGPDVSMDLAASKAAHTVLSSLFPQYSAMYDDVLNNSLRHASSPAQRNASFMLGEHVANQIIALRANDGHDGPMDYTPGTNPGDWRPTPPDFEMSPFTPKWGKVTPWAMTSGDQFRPNGVMGYTNMADLLASQEYTDAFNEVKELGAKNSKTRTAEQTQIGFFWANDLDGTYKPPGQKSNITGEIAIQAGLNTAETARLFAMTSVAMADAGIAAWDSKYLTDIDLWRPITGIREADTDGNPNTISDPTWEPLNPFSPPFPAWVSGHATFGAAHVAALIAFFGQDGIGQTMTITTEDPFYLALGVGNSREYEDFTTMALENWRSRIYIGVHWDFDGLEGNLMGTAIGEWVAANYFGIIPAPGSALLLGLGGLVAARRRRA